MQDVTIACVLRSGGDFTPEHVSTLRDQVAEHAPGAHFVCFSDVDVDCERIELAHGFLRWWAKFELCRPDIEGNFLYFDLDTVIVGDLSEITAVDRFTLLRDFYRPHLAQSGMMYLPEVTRRRIWERFYPNAHTIMTAFRGDGEFLHSQFGHSAARWQDDYPNQVVSYKADVLRDGLHADARVVCFHGKPRPWNVPNSWRLQRAA